MPTPREDDDFIEDDLGTEDQPEPDAAAKDPAAETLKEIRGEISNLRTRLSETEADARFWREQAKGGAKPAGDDEDDEDDDDPKLSDDLLETFSSGDGKRVTKVLKELGFVRESDVQRAIGSTRKEITEQGKLYKEYPDLADPESEFFQATAAVYNDMVKRDPSLKKSPAGIELAARIADAEAKATRKPARRQSADEYEDDDDETETQRTRRVASQSAEQGRPRSRSGASGGDRAELNSAQRNIIAKFQAAGSSLTEDGFRKHATSGVRMSGLPKGRR